MRNPGRPLEPVIRRQQSLLQIRCASPAGRLRLSLQARLQTSLHCFCHPDVKDNIEEIVFMEVRFFTGNITSAAESNIYADPEAAKIVLSPGIPITMVGLTPL